MVRVLIVVGVLAGTLALAGGGATAPLPCWQQVLDDWVPDTRVDRSYAIGCYREAIARLPEDLRAYSSASHDIDRALHAQLASSSSPAKATPIRVHEGEGDRLAGTLVLVASLTAVAALAVTAFR